MNMHSTTPRFLNDPSRVSGCIDRLRFAMRATYYAFIPAMAAIVGTLGLTGGSMGVLFMALIGAGSGCFLSAIVATILEWMWLMLIAVTNQSSPSSTPEE